MKNLHTNRGISILGLVILAFLVILVLSYFNIRIKSVVQSPAGQENIQYVGGETKSFWQAYLEEPASYLWNDVWVKIFWQGFISNMERIRDGQPTDFDKASNGLKINQ